MTDLAVCLQQCPEGYYESTDITGTLIAICINPSNAKLNPICHLLALLGGATIVVVSRLRVEVHWLAKLSEKIYLLTFSQIKN